MSQSPEWICLRPWLAKTRTASCGTLSECCLFFHSQAAVERGFSINKQAEEVHLQAETFETHIPHVICDHVGYVGGIDQVDVACRELLLAASSARQKYNLYLKESKKAEAEQSDKKRKAVSDQIEELKKKKVRLQQDISSLYLQICCLQRQKLIMP